ncbi:MAG: nitrilase-related carbon-nitrogen hydrolase, partial [Candidatus Omnitrophota bacterium]|nr:nitrilase-related carbon-nitrogen hydrolase [Candidatus Omnitrophota bacterium]
MNVIRIAIAQINTIVGDLSGNKDKISLCIEQAEEQDVDLVVFPEMAITGYPPEDLLLKPSFINENLKCLEKIASNTDDLIVALGFVDKDPKGIYNALAILTNKKIEYVHHKLHLPNYGVFDEKRYFKPGSLNSLLKAKDFSFAVNICEDLWAQEDVANEKVLQSAQFLVNISASPYHIGKIEERRKVLTQKAKKFKCSIVYCNLIGGQDELIFDGRSLVVGKDGKLVISGNAFEDDLVVFDLPLGPKKKNKLPSKRKAIHIDYKIKDKKHPVAIQEPIKDMKMVEEVYSALV